MADGQTMIQRGYSHAREEHKQIVEDKDKQQLNDLVNQPDRRDSRGVQAGMRRSLDLGSQGAAGWGQGKGKEAGVAPSFCTSIWGHEVLLLGYRERGLAWKVRLGKEVEDDGGFGCTSHGCGSRRPCRVGERC